MSAGVGVRWGSGCCCLTLVAAFVPACAPDLLDDSFLVDRPRVLAIVAEPPEARPGEDVGYRLLAVSGRGRLTEPNFSADYCASPKPLTENNSVSRECLGEPGSALEIHADGAATGPVPRDACALFGPDPPPGDHRPQDPDATGGYFVPLRVVAYGDTLVFHERIRCNPPDVDADVARDFAARYRRNENPEPPVLTFERAHDGTFSMRARVSSTSAEAYVRVDAATKRVVEDVEQLDVSWFTTAGNFDAPRSLLRPLGDALEAHGALAGVRGATHVWAVIRDDRGGTSHAELVIEPDASR